jgi:hypothetical protein
VLLRAAPTTAPKGAIVAPKEHSRGTRESALRAARKLFHLRLLEFSHEDIRVAAFRGTQTSRFRVAWRSPLAEEIVLRFRRELESGGRIRWDTRLELGARAARRDILVLLRALLAKLEVAYARRHQLAQLVVAFGDVGEAKTRGQLAVDTHALLIAVRGALHVATGAVAEGPAGELLNEGHDT